MKALRRNNVTVTGNGPRTMMFAYGFGCDQSAWDPVAAAFQADYRIVRFDHVGAGSSDISAYDSARYRDLSAYARDVLDIVEDLDLRDIFFVGHSVGAMIGMLAAIEAPERFAALVMVSPSPCYIDDAPYRGGFSRADVDELLEMIDSNFLGWSRITAPAIMGNADRPELGRELGNSFVRTDPAIAREFARVTFLSDHRPNLPNCTIPTLVLQTRADMIAPEEVGTFVAEQMPDAELFVMAATGHCPHISAPDETVAAIRRFADLRL